MSLRIKIAVVVLAALILLIGLGMTLSLPQLPGDLNQIALNTPTVIYGDDGGIIKTLANREVVPLYRVAPVFLQATVALEDAGFYRHHGFSKKGFIRAIVQNLQHGTLRQGGSTITQQLAKNLFFG